MQNIDQISTDPLNPEPKPKTRAMELKDELDIEVTKISQMKKAKRAIAAKQRTLAKKTEPATPEEAERRSREMHDVEAGLDLAKKAVQAQQKVVEQCRQRLKECLNLEAAQQMVSKFPMPNQQQQSTFGQILQQQQQIHVKPTAADFHCDIKPSTSFESLQEHTGSQSGRGEIFYRSGVGTSDYQPCDNSSIATISTHPIKGTRGRKRKKVFEIQKKN